MLKIKNLGPKGFKQYINDKNVYIFGAGRALESCIDLYFSDQSIRKIIDNNEKLWGNTINHRNEDILIGGINVLIEEVKQNRNKASNILMISSPFYAAEIVEMLDKIPELNGLECFLQVLIRNTKEETSAFEFTNGSQKIPKKLHYIWVGGKPLPYEFEKNIESWKQYNSDYEIIRWDESNYDFKKCDYMKEAYESQSWGFVPNYARLDIIHQQGGIYLDTDVEVIRNFDCLLNDDAFFNMGCADRINQGCGFGAVAGHSMIYDMMAEFEKSHFALPNGKPEKKACHTFIHPIIKKYGFEINNEYQNRDGIALYPAEVMSPFTIEGMEDFFSDKTVSVHHEVGTWNSEKEREGAEKLKEIIKNRLKG